MAEDYKPNSHRSKEMQPDPERRQEKVVTGNVVQRKKTGLSKFGSIFLPGDVDSIKSYIWLDVLIPSIKQAIRNIVCNGIDMLLGESGGSKPGGISAKINYRQYYPDDRRSEYSRPRAQAQYSYDDIIFDNRGDAEEVLYRMEEILEHFDAVSVADLFDLAGISSTSRYTDNKFGWTDLRGVTVRRTGNGYMIDLPRATNL